MVIPGSLNDAIDGYDGLATASDWFNFRIVLETIFFDFLHTQGFQRLKKGISVEGERVGQEPTTQKFKVRRTFRAEVELLLENINPIQVSWKGLLRITWDNERVYLAFSGTRIIVRRTPEEPKAI
jgi:hypothetical protein